MRGEVGERGTKGCVSGLRVTGYVTPPALSRLYHEPITIPVIGCC